MAKGSRRGGLDAAAAAGAGEGGKDGEAESVERHERSFDQGASVMMILQLFGSILILILTIIIVIIASAASSESSSSSSSLLSSWSSYAGSSDDQSKYGSPSGANEANVDLHNKVQPSS